MIVENVQVQDKGFHRSFGETRTFSLDFQIFA